MSKNYHIVHGESRRGGDNRLYFVWWAMIQRTTNPKNKAFKDYGGRGISVCDEWLIPANFFVWARNNGYSNGLEIDRINNNGIYCPDNCQFTTKSINCSNRRVAANFGVSYIPKRQLYQVYITRNKIRYYGGFSRNLIEALELRDRLLTK